MKNNIHLLITTAVDKVGSKRHNDVLNTIESVRKYGGKFKSVKLLETVLTTNENLFQGDDFEFYTSTIPNNHKYKGTNWVNHVFEFVNSKYNVDDIIVFLTGRYLMVNDNIFELIEKFIINGNKYFIAKNDGDIYEGFGVHTFYISFTKQGLIDFYNFYSKLNVMDPRIEWDLKKFMSDNDNCKIINRHEILGVETNTSTNTIKIC
jgi:hypothetical protein